MWLANPAPPGKGGEGNVAGYRANPAFVFSSTFAVLAMTVAVTCAAAGEASLQNRLATASTERGQKVFRVCRACHTLDADAAHTVGPNLWAVVGRAVASADGFGRYTPAMMSAGGVWSPERLDRYLRDPATEVEGTAMVFPGIPHAGDRADLIAWLNQNSPDPVDFTSDHATAGDATSGHGTDDTGTAAPRPDRPPTLGVLVAAEGAEETHAYCTACHSERIVAQQGLTRSDWEELLEQMVEENGMDPIEEPDRGRILAYLETHYGPDRPNFPRP